MWRISFWSKPPGSVIDLTVKICSRGFWCLSFLDLCLGYVGRRLTVQQGLSTGLISLYLCPPPPSVIQQLDVQEQSFCLSPPGCSERNQLSNTATAKLLHSQTGEHQELHIQASTPHVTMRNMTINHLFIRCVANTKLSYNNVWKATFRLCDTIDTDR